MHSGKKELLDCVPLSSQCTAFDLPEHAWDWNGHAADAYRKRDRPLDSPFFCNMSSSFNPLVCMLPMDACFIAGSK